MLLEGVAETSRRAAQSLLERLVGERLDLPAIVTHEMVVVMPVHAGRLESRDPVTRVDALHQVQLGEGVECAVDTRDAHGVARRRDPVVDLLRRPAASLDVEELDDRAPRAPPAGPGGADCRQ